MNGTSPAATPSSNDPLAADLSSAQQELANDLAAVRGSSAAVIRAPKETEPVTLGELMDNPVEAMQRIGTLLKRDASDPKTWFTLVGMYLGPKVMNRVMPNLGTSLMRGAEQVGRIRMSPSLQIKPGMGGITVKPSLGLSLAPRAAATPEMPIPAPAAEVTPPAPPIPSAPPTGPRTINAAMEEAIAKAQAAKGTASAATPSTIQATTPVTNAPIPVGRVAAIQRAQRIPFSEAARIAQEEANASAAPVAVTSPVKATSDLLTKATSNKLKLTAAEVKTGADLIRAGKTPSEALDAIQAMRTFAQKFGLPASAEVKAVVKERNAAGEWGEKK